MNLEDQCNYILNKLKQHPSAWPFKEPVNREEVKDYYEIIKIPMDLQTIETKIQKKQYQTFHQFEEDVLLIFSNCKSYNDKKTIYWGHADSLEKYIKPHLNKISKKYMHD